MIVRITGPGMYEVVSRACEVYEDVLAGQWQIVIELFPTAWEDKDAAEEEFRQLGRKVRARKVQIHVQGEGDNVTYTGPPADLTNALDLFQRLYIGQFHEMVWATASSMEMEFSEPDIIRCKYQRDGVWPRHPNASWSINNVQVPEFIRYVYDAWKHMGGGMIDRMPLTGKVTVEKEG